VHRPRNLEVSEEVVRIGRHPEHTVIVVGGSPGGDESISLGKSVSKFLIHRVCVEETNEPVICDQLSSSSLE
jgi:hypothetical protein